MTQARLKPVRVGVSLVFLAACCAVFLDPDARAPAAFTDAVTFLQFTPSLLQFLATLSLGAAGALIVLLLTLLAGRVYCSTICPLGTLQDVLSLLARRRKRRFWYREEPPRSALRYGFLALAVLPALGGVFLGITLLDPFSIFGRILTTAGLPPAVGVKNLLAWTLETAGIYAVYPAHLPAFSPAAAAVAALSLLVVCALAWRRGRLFCNTVCPVGTLLGLVSRVAVFRVAVDTAHCTSCGLCERVCKAGCIDAQAKQVDMSRCVACCNCLTICASDAIRYERARAKRTPAPPADPGRRAALLGGAAFLLGGSGVSGSRPVPVPERLTTVAVLKKHAVTPPGARSIDRFTATCTGCQLCVSACPARVLAPAFLEYGLAGMLQPRMDFAASYCTYECTRCTDVCPTGALLPLALSDKKLVQVGAASFIKENCIVHTEKKECGACSEHCPTKAVKMVPYGTTRLVIPEVTPELCIGCGACEHACPTVPWRAIFVDGKPVHARARPPAPAPGRNTEEVPAEFPF